MMIGDDVVWFLAGWEIMVGGWIGCWMLYVVIRYILVVISMLISRCKDRARCEAPWFFASTCILNNTMTNVPV